MDSTQVTAKQAEEVAARVAPMLGYLTRLYDRMQKRGWVGGDPLYEDVRKAHEAMHRLTTTVRELGRLQRASSPGPRPWEPGGSGRSSGG